MSVFLFVVFLVNGLKSKAIGYEAAKNNENHPISVSEAQSEISDEKLDKEIGSNKGYELRLYCFEGGAGRAGSTIEVWSTLDFDEYTVTWDNRPPTAQLLTWGRDTATNAWYTWASSALDTYIDSCRTYNEQPRFCIFLNVVQSWPCDNIWRFYTKENGSNIPQLVIGAHVLTPSGDARVYEHTPFDNYGSDYWTWVCNCPSPKRQLTFLEFPIPPVGIEEAKGAKEMLNCSPNPFSFIANISYSINESKFVRLSIYDITGKCVAKLVNKIQPQGHYTIHWDGKDESGKKLPKGIYFIKFIAGKESTTHKLTLIY